MSYFATQSLGSLVDLYCKPINANINISHLKIIYINCLSGRHYNVVYNGYNFNSQEEKNTFIRNFIEYEKLEYNVMINKWKQLYGCDICGRTLISAGMKPIPLSKRIVPNGFIMDYQGHLISNGHSSL